MEWWQLSPEEIAVNPEAQRLRRIAYYNTFYAPTEGRQVLLDIKRMCYDSKVPAEALIALIQLFEFIRGKAGGSIESDMAALSAEAENIVIE